MNQCSETPSTKCVRLSVQDRNCIEGNLLVQSEDVVAIEAKPGPISVITLKSGVQIKVRERQEAICRLLNWSAVDLNNHSYIEYGAQLMLFLSIGEREVFINKNEVALVKQIDKDTVNVLYAHGPDKYNAVNYADPNIVDKVMKLFTNEKMFIKLRGNAHCVNPNRIRKVEFRDGVATLTFANGDHEEYDAEDDVKKLDGYLGLNRHSANL